MLDSGRWVLRVPETGKTKQPYCFEVNDGQLFAFAGIWEGWKDPGGKVLETCSILTTAPNALTSAVHDRMPVILEPDSYDVWLDPGMSSAHAFANSGRFFLIIAIRLDSRCMRLSLVIVL
jgi:putative SOS response-associated peptidase YedK